MRNIIRIVHRIPLITITCLHFLAREGNILARRIFTSERLFDFLIGSREECEEKVDFSHFFSYARHETRPIHINTYIARVMICARGMSAFATLRHSSRLEIEIVLIAHVCFHTNDKRDEQRRRPISDIFAPREILYSCAT